MKDIQELKEAENLLKRAKDVVLKSDSEIAEAKAQVKILKETLKKNFNLNSAKEAEKMINKLKKEMDLTIDKLTIENKKLSEALDKLGA